MQTLKGVTKPLVLLACTVGLGRVLGSLHCASKKEHKMGHLLNPIAHSRDSSVDYGVMHSKRVKSICIQ
jgi:hypothetical protein